jgi:glyoxalase family protein
MTRPNISGIHHITAISASAVENLAFYENTLGLRLVKQTVNFDDPSTYHLYYGDEQGTPGTILTFFPWEKLPQGRPGSGMVTAIAFAVPMTMDSMDFWKRRMAAAGIRIDTIERFGEPVIRFVDPHGLPLELIGVSHPPDTSFRQAGTIPKAHAITGFHSATTTLNDLESITALLQGVMGMTLSGQEKRRHRFSMDNPEAPGHYYDLVVDPQAHSGRPGSGTVHHIAFRTENDATQVQWQSILRGSGFEVTDVRDRQYFRSIYYRSPGGVLFEMATDSPGFSVDEAAADLGTSLKLPPQYERSRAAIEKQLPALRVGASRTEELHFLT